MQRIYSISRGYVHSGVYFIPLILCTFRSLAHVASIVAPQSSRCSRIGISFHSLRAIYINSNRRQCCPRILFIRILANEPVGGCMFGFVKALSGSPRYIHPCRTYLCNAILFNFLCVYEELQAICNIFAQTLLQLLCNLWLFLMNFLAKCSK